MEVIIIIIKYCIIIIILNIVSGLDALREITNGFLGHFIKTVYQFDGDGYYIFLFTTKFFLMK